LQSAKYILIIISRSKKNQTFNTYTVLHIKTSYPNRTLRTTMLLHSEIIGGIAQGLSIAVYWTEMRERFPRYQTLP